MRAPLLGEQFADFEAQDRALELGMWLFLVSEVLLFAGLFTLYAAYRSMYLQEFEAAIAHNTLWFGTANMYILLTSSVLAALSVAAIRSGRPHKSSLLLAATAGLGLVFLAVKFWEYIDHWHHGMLPGPLYHYAALPSFGANRFFTLYWVMTGIHALHVTGGIGVVTWMSIRAWAGFYTPDHHVRLEMGTLYWHLVDLIWIFLWPLLYLS